MANLDRSAYGSDKLDDFEADESVEEENSRLPLLVAIALVVLAAFGGVVWLAYSQGVERGRADAPRMMVAQSRPTPQKAAQSPYAGLNIYQPPSQQSATSDSDATDSVPPPPTPLAASHPSNSPPTLRPSASATQETPPAAHPLALPPKETAVPKETAPKVAATPVQQKAASPSQQKVAAPAQQEAESADQDEALPPPPKPTVTASPAPTAPATADADAPHPASTGKGVLLQIGSYKSQAEAMQSWAAFKSRHAVAAGYQPNIQKVELGAKGTWYRLRLGSLSDKQSAVALCGKLKAQGASCLIAR
ncbi:MAG TPA: SPOR domain-containing protein [Rhizomicrobium sp.]